jgi:HSP20 family protein
LGWRLRQPNFFMPYFLYKFYVALSLFLYFQNKLSPISLSIKEIKTMTFYIQTYPYAQAKPQHRVVRRWVENREQALGVNIREEDNAYLLSSLVPGLKAEDLNIQVLDDVLRIEGEYKADEQEYLVRELPSGSFTRTLRLPAAIEADSVEAKIADGVLTLKLPKAESARAKRIQVTVK